MILHPPNKASKCFINPQFIDVDVHAILFIFFVRIFAGRVRVDSSQIRALFTNDTERDVVGSWRLVL